MRLTDKQKDVWQESVYSPKRWNISVGAVRSGKTYLDFYRIPRRILSADKKGGIALVGNTEASVERNILSPMRGLFGQVLVGRIGSGGSVRLFGRDCFVIGAARGCNAGKLQGASLSYCYGDEITTWSEEMFRMIASRLDREGSVFDGSCNPASPGHWFKQFLDKGERDGSVRVSHFSIDDNPALPPGFAEALKKEYAGTVYYDRYILGLWKSAEGVIYRQFADRPQNYICGDEGKFDIIMADMGVDFGGNGSATAFNVTGYTAGYKDIVVLDEYYRKGIISPSELEADFVAFVKKVRRKYPMLCDIYCDSAEQVLIRGLENAARRAALPVELHNARKGEISQRIRFYSSIIGDGRFRIMRHCKNTAAAFANAVWEGGGSDRRLDDGSVNVDSLDAQEYSTERRMSDILSCG